MRIPFPERVNFSYALICATVLCSIQLFEGTNPVFTGLVFCFLMVAAAGFNIAGGFPFPSGAFIGFNAIVMVILPMVTKAILREPADSNLRAPMRTIEVYLLGMAGMAAGAILSRRFRTRRAFISGMLPADRLHAAYVGCAVLSILLTGYLLAFGTGRNGSLASFLMQANRFPMLTFVLGVIYMIHRTDGRRSISWPLFAMILIFSLGALVTFSKEQFLSPFFAWAVTAALMRYRLNWINVAAFGIGIYLVVAFMFPYAQYGRDFTAQNLSRTQIAVYLLTHMNEVNDSYAENQANVGDIHYYNNRHGLLDRLDILSVDDAIIDVTDREGTFGFSPMIAAIDNFVPHFLWPNKPPVYFGNTYAHEIGILSDEDITTGVSFSPSADAYHQGRMTGVLVLEPLVFIFTFLVLDCVIGDVRLNPVGLLTTMTIGRIAYEGMLTGALALTGQLMFTNVLAALVCAYVLPVLGSAFSKAGSSLSLMRPGVEPLLGER